MVENRPVARTARHAIAGLTLSGLAAAAVALAVPTSPASADPSANDWNRLRMCESSDNYKINTGNGHYGAYQFDLSTWRSVGGRGFPNQASPAEQDARALLLYRMRGWQPWQCAGIVGLREDRDARSGRTSGIAFPAAGTAGTTPKATRKATPKPATPPSTGVPAWPGPRYFSIGDHHNTVARFQAQLHRRGSFLVGNGDFGPNTLGEVKRIQGQNGLPQTGLLGPVTWRLAWTGAYRPGAAATRTVPKPATRHAAQPKPVTKPATAPKWPGPQYFSIGDHHNTIARFQAQLHRRGSFLVGDGNFGPNTQAAVKHIQKLNGLPPTGLLGPVTWKLAWAGRWTNIAPV